MEDFIDEDIIMTRLIHNKQTFNDGCDSKDNYQSKYSKISIITSSNTAITFSNNKLKASSAEISDHVILSYKESDKSVLSAPPSNVSFVNYKYDILKRIKQAYQACSCKVCECIFGYPLNRSLRTYETNPQCNSSTKCDEKKPKRFCPCIRCYDSNDCKCITSNAMGAVSCDCKPCGCIKCTENISKPCDCKQCQCIVCENISMLKQQTLVIAPFTEDINRNVCQCSPCECFECITRHRIGPNVANETSTEISRHPNCNCDTCFNDECVADGIDACRCGRHSDLMRKPVGKNLNDYDIHTASVIKPEIVLNRKGKVTSEMVVSTSSNPTNLKAVSAYSCQCQECECIFCRNKIKLKILPQICHQFFFEDYGTNYSCNCKHCKYQTCHINEIFGPMQSSKLCKCEICDCLRCGDLSKTNNKYRDIFKDLMLNSGSNCINTTVSKAERENFVNKFSGPVFIDNNTSRQISQSHINSSIENHTNSCISGHFTFSITNPKNSEFTVTSPLIVESCLISNLKSNRSTIEIHNKNKTRPDYQSTKCEYPSPFQSLEVKMCDINNQDAITFEYPLQSVKNDLVYLPSTVGYFPIHSRMSYVEYIKRSLNINELHLSGLLTLKKAKDFSMKLNKLLNDYENANKNFVKVSAKYCPELGEKINTNVIHQRCNETICNEISKNVFNIHDINIEDKQFAFMNKSAIFVLHPCEDIVSFINSSHQTYLY